MISDHRVVDYYFADCPVVIFDVVFAELVECSAGAALVMVWTADVLAAVGVAALVATAWECDYGHFAVVARFEISHSVLQALLLEGVRLAGFAAYSTACFAEKYFVQMLSLENQESC